MYSGGGGHSSPQKSLGLGLNIKSQDFEVSWLKP